MLQTRLSNYSKTAGCNKKVRNNFHLLMNYFVMIILVFLLKDLFSMYFIT